MAVYVEVMRLISKNSTIVVLGDVVHIYVFTEYTRYACNFHTSAVQLRFRMNYSYCGFFEENDRYLFYTFET